MFHANTIVVWSSNWAAAAMVHTTSQIFTIFTDLQIEVKPSECNCRILKVNASPAFMHFAIR